MEESELLRQQRQCQKGGAIRYEITGEPVPWSSHRGYGKKSFNPKYKEKEAARWSLSNQHDQRPLLSGALRVDLFFEMPIPKSIPKKLLSRILSGEKVWHIKRPDIDNLRKFINDCFTGTVWVDDSQIVAGESQKCYSLTPKTTIIVQEI